MPLPINIKELLHGQIVEWERIEFKKGWNPESVLHTICAFANDINNWGGGYIFIGIEEEKGHPVLPPAGLQPHQIDKIQKELLQICHRITPNYFPVAVPEIFQKKNILIIWVPGGDTRPYKAAQTLNKKSQQVYYIRRFSSTMKANKTEELRLMELASKIPFDDRINHNAFIEDLNLTYIKAFLKEIGSSLFEQADKIPFNTLCRQMQIVRGPDEYLKPVNAGLLMFTSEPEKFFPGAKIEIIEYFDDIGDKFTEKIFSGPIHIQLRDALQYIKNNFIKEQVHKIKGKAEAERIYNYPYEAIEEALANAVYHRSYENRSSIEVNLRLDRIEIISYPGPIPPVTNESLKQDRIIAKEYRNRRIGDFLKELDLTEGRGTGIPKIRRSLKNNYSPEPVFETDDQLLHFLSIIYINPYFLRKISKNTSKDEGLNEGLNEGLKSILHLIEKNQGCQIKRLAKLLNNRPIKTVERQIKILKKYNLIEHRGSKKTGGYFITTS